jgi:hypothetical protein
MDNFNTIMNLINSCFCIKICDKIDNQKESTIVKNINSSDNSCQSIQSNKLPSLLSLNHSSDLFSLSYSSQSISSDNLSDDSLLGIVYT